MDFAISLFQMKPILGNIKENTSKILNYYNGNLDTNLIVTPELALCGYSPMDNLFSHDFKTEILLNIKIIQKATLGKKTSIIIGTPWFKNDKIYNVALVITNGEIQDIIYKTKLPNYGVFNEYRYFSTNNETRNIVKIGNKNIALFVCEDMWHRDKIDILSDKKIDFIISINASPFELSLDDNKNNNRLQVSQYATQKLSAAVFYLNIVGGVDDVIFDGSSFIVDSQGNQIGCLSHAKEDSLTCIIDDNNFIKINKELKVYSNYNKNFLIYEIIQLGLKDFIEANSFNGVIIGISGGIDSTITATIAVDALGTKNVLGISMPSKYTSKLSYNIINEMRKSLGINIIEIPIDKLVKSYKDSLSNNLNLEENNILDNIQARIRGQILMAYSNQYKGFMVLTTGNKSETAVGYSTIYGDSCGGYNLLKDLYKTQIFELSKWRNENIVEHSNLQKLNVIPKDAIARRPSAELQENQYDEDSLMDYNTLDDILYKIIEKNYSVDELYKIFSKNLVDKLIRLLKISHYKRCQSATGVNVSTKPFGKDYQYNISDSFKINNTKQ